MNKKDKKPEYIKAIEAKPKEERTGEEFIALGNWKFKNPSTPEEKEVVDKLNKMFADTQKSIDKTLKLLGVEHLPPEEQSAAFIEYLKQRDEADEAKLKNKGDATPGDFKVSEHFLNAFLLKGITRASEKEDLQPEAKQAIMRNNKDLNTVFEGIHVTRAEYELLLVIAKLTYEDFKSVASKDGANLIKEENKHFGLTRQIRSIKRILITPYELAKEYNGGNNPSGNEIRAIENRLKKLAKKKQLITVKQREYTSKRYYKGKDGKMKVNKNPDYIEHEVPFYEELFTVEKTVVTSKKYKDGNLINELNRDALIIKPSPLFNEQLQNYFVSIPKDFRRRNMEAKNNSLAFVKLQTYFIRQIKYNFLKDEILIDTLYQTIAPIDMDGSRITKAKNDTSAALKTCKNIGLLKSYSIVKNNKGKDKLIFELNENW